MNLRGKTGLSFLFLFLAQSIVFGFVLVKASGVWDFAAILLNFCAIYILAKKIWARKEEILTFSPTAQPYFEPTKKQRKIFFIFDAANFVVFFGLSAALLIALPGSAVGQPFILITLYIVGQIGLVGIIHSLIEYIGKLHDRRNNEIAAARR